MQAPQLNSAQQARVEAFQKDLEALKQQHGITMLPMVAMSPTGMNWILQCLPDEIANPTIGVVQPGQRVPVPNPGLKGGA